MLSPDLFDALPGMPASSSDQCQAPAGPPASLPAGLHYEQDFLTPAEESELIERLSGIEYAPFMLRGYPSKRLVASFGMALDFRGGTSWPQRPPPEYLLPCIEHVASRLGVPPRELAHVLVTLYPPGAIINWHRDAAQFELICGISLGSPCTLRLRPCPVPQASGSYRSPGGSARPGRSPRLSVKLTLAARSLYIMRDAARSDWEHSIAPLKARRYSITLRTLYPDADMPVGAGYPPREGKLH